MKQIQQLLNEILEITLKIEKEYPELYQFLDENPITIPTVANPEMNTKTFSEWLDRLQQLLKNHMENHQPNNINIESKENEYK